MNDCNGARVVARQRKSLESESQVATPSPKRPRDAARVGLCASVPGRFTPQPKRCSALVPVPPLLRTPRARRAPRLERHESGAHPDRGRATAQRAAAHRRHAYCAPAPPEASPHHAHLILRIWRTLARRRARALADPKQGGARESPRLLACWASSCVYAASRCGSPLPLPAPSKTLSEQRTARTRRAVQSAEGDCPR